MAGWLSITVPAACVAVCVLPFVGRAGPAVSGHVGSVAVSRRRAELLKPAISDRVGGGALRLPWHGSTRRAAIVGHLPNYPASLLLVTALAIGITGPPDITPHNGCAGRVIAVDSNRMPRKTPVRRRLL
jgi:hypothetical protein